MLNYGIIKNTNSSYYSGLSLSRTRKGPTNLFEIEKITVKIKIFTNKAREVNKDSFGMYQISSLNAQKTFLVAIEFLNFELFDHIRVFKYLAFLFYLLCKWILRQGKVRDRERNSRKRPRFLFETEKIREREVRDKEIKIAYIVHKCPRD